MNETTNTNISTSTATAGLSPGDKLGPYRIERKIGSGGMAEVYFSIHEGLHRPAAIKVLRESLASDDVHLQRFMQEARAAAQLIHPNIVQVYDVGQDGRNRYIAQEYVPGCNLRQYLQDRGALPVKETLSILLQVLAALSKSAAAGIVHRDIKPENIMLNEDGDVKVADYGLARVLLSDDPQLTRAGTTLGTPMYMSPEQLQEGAVDIRSDLYSLGVTLYHMLAGRPPFTGETPLALAMQHVQVQPPELTQFRPGLPESLVQLVHRLLSKSQEQRFATPAEVLELLRAHRHGDLSEHWPDHTIPLPGAASAVVAGPSAATLMLQAKVNRQRALLRRRFLLLSAGPLLSVAALWLGSVAGRITFRGVLAVDSSSQQEIEMRDTVEEQFADALLAVENRRARWLAVPQYFPPETSEKNRLYAGKAWLQLSTLMVERGDLSAARSYADQILLDDQMPEFLRVLATIAMAEIYETEGKGRLADGELQKARRMAQGDRITRTDRDQIDLYMENVDSRLQDLWNPS